MTKFKKIKSLYKTNKNIKIGEGGICPSCGNKFIKTNYQQAFCRSKGGTICKDKYWNTIIKTKRNNTTRISPANAKSQIKWLCQYVNENEDDFDYDAMEHPFSSEALGQS